MKVRRLESGDRVAHTSLRLCGTVERRCEPPWDCYVVVRWDRSGLLSGYLHETELKAVRRIYMKARVK